MEINLNNIEEALNQIQKDFEPALKQIQTLFDPTPIKVVTNHPNAVLPTRATKGSAGMDLYSVESVTLAPGEYKLVPTGLSMSIPAGFEVQIRPRSGLALKQGVTVLNSPGTIDSDYRGEVGVILINHGHQTVTLHSGERIAQMVIGSVTHLDIKLVETLDETERGEGGFGSTGSN